MSRLVAHGTEDAPVLIEYIIRTLSMESVLSDLAVNSELETHERGAPPEPCAVPGQEEYQAPGDDKVTPACTCESH